MGVTIIRIHSKVAVIGPADIVADCLKYQKLYPTLILNAFSYPSEKDTLEIVEGLGDDYDFLLFAGPIPYYKALNKDRLKKIPSLYVPFHGSALLRALFQVQIIAKVSKISIDTVNLKLLLEAFSELELAEAPQYIFEFGSEHDSKDLVDYHKNLYLEGKTEAAVTGIASCYQELVKAGVPCIKIRPLKSVIRETLEKVKLTCESINNVGSQISVGIVSVNRYDEWSQDKLNNDSQHFHLQLEQLVFNFTKELDGQYIQTSPREFLFFTTRALIEKATESFNVLPSIFYKRLLPKEVTLNLGIGIGGTTNLAANSARIAVKKAQQAGGNCCFLVNENQQIVCLLTIQRKAKIMDLRTTDTNLLELAERTTLSAITLRRVFQAIHQVGDEFTANEIAPYMGVSVKSMQKIIRLLEKGNIINVIGKVALQTKGKPRRIFRLRE